MTRRESAHHGNVVFFQVLGKHCLGAFVVEVGAGIHEFAEDNALYIFHDAVQFDRVEHAVNVAQVFADFFHKEDDAFVLEYVDVGCADERDEGRHVAAHENALGGPVLVILVRRNLVYGNITLEKVAQELAVVFVATGLCDA